MLYVMKLEHGRWTEKGDRLSLMDSFNTIDFNIRVLLPEYVIYYNATHCIEVVIHLNQLMKF
jgi:hypothetical protein